MTPIEEALAKSRGARFWKCALQVNTSAYLAKWRGQHQTDLPAFNQNMLEACRNHGIEVVGLADHDDFELYDDLAATLTAAGIKVFPGFEITSLEGFHMVCLYALGTSSQRLREFRGALGIHLDDPTKPADKGSLEIARTVMEKQGGVWYAPHMTQENGILQLKRHDAWRESRWVLAGHIPGSVEDLPSNYRQIVQNKNPDYARERDIACLHAADVNCDEDLAKPAASCFIKMTEPSIEALIQAFLDPESRIRLAEPKSSYAEIEAIAIDNGYFDGLRLHLSNNLNAIIGGRGTGKSTLIECIRYALELQPIGEDARKAHTALVRNALENGGMVYLRVRSAAQLGRCFTISRRYGEPAEVRDEYSQLSRLSPSTLLPAIAIYGQNEILEIAKSPTMVFDLVRGLLLETRLDLTRQQELAKKLAENRLKIVKTRNELDNLESRLNQLSVLEERSEYFQTLHLEEKLGELRLVQRERQILERTKADAENVAAALAALQEALPEDLAYLADTAVAELPHANLWTRLREKIEEGNADLKILCQKIAMRVEQLLSTIQYVESEWNTGRHAIEGRVYQVVAGLPGLAGKSGEEIGREYGRVIQQVEALRPLAAKKETQRRLFAALEEERRNLLSEWRAMQHEIFDRLNRAAKDLNKKALTDKLRIAVKKWGNRDPLKDFLLTIEGVGEAKVRWVDEVPTLSIAALLDAIDKGVMALLEQYKEIGLSRVTAERISSLPLEKRLALEEIMLEPSVELLLNVAGEGTDFKSVNDLSTGQKCTAILHLLLLESHEPLIADQPEDHLDNAFIADHIVQELRATKQCRQFLLATHNANIPVFGDAEWIAPLYERAHHSGVDELAMGSIDLDSVKIRVSQILEGGRDAFEMRRAKYGY